MPPRAEEQNHLIMPCFGRRVLNTSHKEVLGLSNAEQTLYGKKYGMRGKYKWAPCRLNPKSGKCGMTGPRIQRLMASARTECAGDDDRQRLHRRGITTRVTHHTTFNDEGQVE